MIMIIIIIINNNDYIKNNNNDNYYCKNHNADNKWKQATMKNILSESAYHNDYCKHLSKNV